MRFWRWWQWATVLAGVAMVLFMLAVPAHAAETLIKSNATGGSGNFDWQAVGASGSGLFQVGGVTWDTGSTLGITKVKIHLAQSSGACTIYAFLAQGDTSTPTNKIYSASAVNITQAQGANPGTFAEYEFTFTPTYSADDTFSIGFENGTCGGSTVRAKIAAATVWGTASDMGFSNSPYGIPKVEIYGDDIAEPVGDYNAAIEKPAAGNYTAPVPLRVGTDILASDVDGTGQGVAFQVLLEAYSGSWSEYDTYEYTDADAPLTYTCSTLFAGTFAGPCVKLGSVLDTFTLPDLPDGNYRVSARVAIIEDDEPGPYGEWSATRSFTVGEASPISTDIAALFTEGSASEECGAANPWDVETTGWEGFIDGIKRALWGFFWVDCVTTQPLVDLRDELALHAPFRQAFQTLGYFVDALNNAQAPEDSNLSIPAPAPWEGSDIVIFSPEAVYDFMGGEDGWGTLVRPLIAAGTALALGLYFVRDWSNFFGTNA